MPASVPGVVVAVQGPFEVGEIESRFSPEEPAYPPEVEHAFRLLTEDLRRRAVAGELVPYDSEGFKLVGFAARRPAGLLLSFAPSTYYRMLATHGSLDAPLDIDGDTRTLRERFAMHVDLRVRPVAEFATFWSVGVSIVTADGWLLASERGATALDPHVCGPAVGEGATRGEDADASGAPDHYLTARRGLREELGLGLAPDDLTWLSLSATADTFHYALIGRVSTALTLREVEERRSANADGDGWETRHLHAVEFEPLPVARFSCDPMRRFSAFGLAAVVQTLEHEYGKTRAEAAFREVTARLRS